jgi:predicted nucleic acid-binding protein
MVKKTFLLLTYLVGREVGKNEEKQKRNTRSDEKMRSVERMKSNSKITSNKYYEDLSKDEIEKVWMNRDNDAAFLKTGYPPLLLENMKEAAEEEAAEIEEEARESNIDLTDFFTNYLYPKDKNSESISSKNNLGYSFLDCINEIYMNESKNKLDYMFVLDGQVKYFILTLIYKFNKELVSTFNVLLVSDPKKHFEELSKLRFMKDEKWFLKQKLIDKFFFSYVFLYFSISYENLANSIKMLNMELFESLDDFEKTPTISKFMHKYTSLNVMKDFGEEIIQTMAESIDKVYENRFGVKVDDDTDQLSGDFKEEKKEDEEEYEEEEEKKMNGGRRRKNFDINCGYCKQHQENPKIELRHKGNRVHVRHPHHLYYYRNE